MGLAERGMSMAPSPHPGPGRQWSPFSSVIPLDDSSNQPPSPVGAGEAGSVAPGEERATEAWLLPSLL